MKHNKPRLAILLFVVILMTVSANSTANELQSNIITSSNKSIILDHWQIAHDPAPNDVLQIPNDSLWIPIDNRLIIDKYETGNWIIRTDIIIEDSVISKTVWGVFPLYFITAYEIYWDGNKIVQNGVIGINEKSEEAGSFNFNSCLPLHLLTPGSHSIILRLSNHQWGSSWNWLYGDIIVGPYGLQVNKMAESHYQAFFVIGIVFIPFLFNLFLYFARKRKTEHLLFSIICFIVILDSTALLVPILTNAPTTFIHWQNYAYQTITILFAILFPAFFIYLFSFPKKVIGLVTVIILGIYIFIANILNVFSVMTLAVLIISSIITVLALIKRHEGSLIIFIGLLGAWAAFFFNIAFAGLATFMVICTSFSIARQFARNEKAEKEAQLRSSHLENELLKKNINPHFLLNTLTSIIVWLRKDPASAVKLIESLAEEFRMVLQISSRRLISIKQEIDLCKTHLKIMNYRKGSDYELVTLDINEDVEVPPMIFHTLIENGLTHGYENKTKGTFKLRQISNAQSIQYVLTNDGDFTCTEPKDSSGFGIKYVKSRLEESFPDRWELISHRSDNRWETIIEIKDN